MNKHARMTAFVAGLDADPASVLDPCYQGYFRCFNEGRYSEAHDVLEHLWLQGGRTDPDHAFYKGLIQVAGAFVHLRKQHEHPAHAKHGRRLRPAARLFALAAANLAAYGPRPVRGVRRGDHPGGRPTEPLVAGPPPATPAPVPAVTKAPLRRSSRLRPQSAH